MRIFPAPGQGELSDGDRADEEGGAVHGQEILAPPGIQHRGSVPAEGGVPGEHDGEADKGGRGVPEILQLLAREEDKAPALGAEGEGDRVQLERCTEQER